MEKLQQQASEHSPKGSLINSLLHKAIFEQKMADEDVMRFLEEHKRERMPNDEMILQLERQLDAKQKLELQIEQLKGNLQAVMQHMGNEAMDSKKKIVEMKEELEAKIEEMDYMQTLIKDLYVQALIEDLYIKECLNNDGLRKARRELKQLLKSLF